MLRDRTMFIMYISYHNISHHNISYKKHVNYHISRTITYFISFSYHIVCVHARACAGACVCARAYVHIYIRVHMCVYMYTYTYVYICVYIYVFIYTYVYMYIYPSFTCHIIIIGYRKHFVVISFPN